MEMKNFSENFEKNCKKSIDFFRFPVYNIYRTHFIGRTGAVMKPQRRKAVAAQPPRPLDLTKERRRAPR